MIGDHNRAAPDVREAVAELRDRIAILESEAANRRADVAHFAALEVDLIREIAALRSMEGSVEHLRAMPYIADLSVLRVRDADGRAVMGYVHDDDHDPLAAYADFEALFRGSRPEVQRRQQPYVDMVRGPGPVLDLGCGRGEFLELLRDAGIAGSGVDLDAGMVAEARDCGLAARMADLFGALGELADGSVGAVFSAQVIEHLPPPDMQRMLTETHRVLADEGVAVVETVNPHSVRAFRFFWLDRTHTIPVYPESALMMARAAGFPAATVYFPEGSDDLTADLRDCGDFALVCAKRPERLVEIGLLAR